MRSVGSLGPDEDDDDLDDDCDTDGADGADDDDGDDEENNNYGGDKEQLSWFSGERPSAATAPVQVSDNFPQTGW